MKNLIKKINSSNIDINLFDFKFIFVDLQQLINILNNEKNINNKTDITEITTERSKTSSTSSTKFVQFPKTLVFGNLHDHSSVLADIIDIKEFNDKQKIILTMFINDYVFLNPTISVYSKYSHILHKKINPLNFPTIFRGFYVATSILNQTQIKSNYINILQIGVIPTFLEAYVRLNQTHNNPSEQNIDFIQILSSKYESNNNMIDLYNQIIKKFTDMFPQINLIPNLSDFYSKNIQKLIMDKTLRTKYDLIIFDTYKNLSNISFDEIESDINIRLQSAIVHTKYILHQIIFSLNKLNSNGDLIILLPGSNHLFYQQLITLLSCLFESIILSNTTIDYSWRYFLVAKTYKPNDDLIKKISSSNYDLSNNMILINLYDQNNKVLDINFEKYLRLKFINIQQKIIGIDDFFKNDLFIKKIYSEIYPNQLTNTYNWLGKIFESSVINYQIISEVFDYKKKLFEKFSQIKQYNFHLNQIDQIRIKLIGLNLDMEVVYELIPIIKCLKLYNLIVYDQNYTENVSSDKSIYDKLAYTKIFNQLYLISNIRTKISDIISDYDMNLIEILNDHLITQNDIQNIILAHHNDLSNIKNTLNYFKITNILYIDWDYYMENILTSDIDFDNLNNHILIKFQLESISPFLISFLFILCHIYSDIKIIKPQFSNSYYYIKIDNFLSTKYDDVKIAFNLIKSERKVITKNYQILAINDDFLYELNKIFNKVFIIDLINNIRCKYVFNNSDYINLHSNINKNTNNINKLIYKWILNNLSKRNRR
jgi:hypothetical protein